MARFSAPLLLLLLAAAPARAARADAREDALALARSVVEKHRSESHRGRFEVVLPEPKAAPEKGSARLEARSGRYAIEERGYALVLDATGARLTVIARTHIPVFAARASHKRDTGQLLEASVPIARARVALLALELIAGAREKAKDGARPDPLDPRLDQPEASGEEDWPRLAVTGDGRRASRRGAFAELARRLLDDLAAEMGLSDPLDRDAALGRLVAALAGSPDEAARAAFILGDAAFLGAWPALSKLSFEEARDAREKIAARSAKDARGALLALSTGASSWDVRCWARERLPGREWIAALLASKDASEDALVEALSAVEARDDASGERTAPFMEDARPSVRAEAAATVLRLTGATRARDILVTLAASSAVPEDVRETAVARLGASLTPTELGTALSPIVTDPDAPPPVRAQAARSLDQGEAVSATPALVRALEGELARSWGADARADDASHDLRRALVAALSTVAVKARSMGSPGEEALRTLGRAAVTAREDDVRALAIHAAGALPGETADKIVEAAALTESKREPPARLSRRAAELETAARAKGEDGPRLVAFADSVCEAPVRSTLERLAVAARSPAARAVLVDRLKARGADGEVGLQVLERR